MPLLGAAKVKVVADTKEYKKGLNTAEARARRFGESAEKHIGMATKAMAAAGVAATALAVKYSAEVGSAFEQSMATVRGVMRATEQEFNALTDIARQMGEQTEWSASQSASALQFLGMAGFDAQQAIAQMAMSEANDQDVRIAAFDSLARSAKINANLLLTDQINAIYALVSSTEADPDLRGAAAGAYGALNLPSEQVKKLILDQAKS